jgi:hypothetical protein
VGVPLLAKVVGLLQLGAVLLGPVPVHTAMTDLLPAHLVGNCVRHNETCVEGTRGDQQSSQSKALNAERQLRVRPHPAEGTKLYPETNMIAGQSSCDRPSNSRACCSRCAHARTSELIPVDKPQRTKNKTNKYIRLSQMGRGIRLCSQCVTPSVLWCPKTRAQEPAWL